MFVLCRQTAGQRPEDSEKIELTMGMELMEGALQKPNLASGDCGKLLRCRQLFDMYPC